MGQGDKRPRDHQGVEIAQREPFNEPRLEPPTRERVEPQRSSGLAGGLPIYRSRVREEVPGWRDDLSRSTTRTPEDLARSTIPGGTTVSPSLSTSSTLSSRPFHGPRNPGTGIFLKEGTELVDTDARFDPPSVAVSPVGAIARYTRPWSALPQF